MASDFFLKFDDFHKFESFEDAGEQVAHDLRHIGRNSVELGDGFLKIIQDGTLISGAGVSSESVSPAALDIKFKHDDALISHDFFKIGTDFLNTAEAQHKVDIKEIVIIKQVDKASPILFSETSDSGGGGGAGKVAADFASYEADLNAIGTDFLKISPGIADQPTETISLNFGAISVDYKEQSADLHKLSADFIALARSASDLKIRGLSDAAIKWSADAEALAADYLKVSADFQKISQDFAPDDRSSSAAGAPTFNQVVLQNPADFVTLAGDIKFMNADYKMLAGDTIKLTDAFESASHQLPAVQKTT